MVFCVRLRTREGSIAPRTGEKLGIAVAFIVGALVSFTPSCAAPAAGPQAGRRGGKADLDLLSTREAFAAMRRLPSYRILSVLAPGPDCVKPAAPAGGYQSLLDKYARAPEGDSSVQLAPCVDLGTGVVDGVERHLVLREAPDNPYLVSENPYANFSPSTSYAETSSDEVQGTQSALAPIAIPIAVLAIPAISAATIKTTAEVVALTSVAVYWYYEAGGRELLAGLLESMAAKMSRAADTVLESVGHGLRNTWAVLSAVTGVWWLGYNEAAQREVTPDRTVDVLLAAVGRLAPGPDPGEAASVPELLEEPDGLPPFFTQRELDEMDASLERAGVTDDDIDALHAYLDEQGLLHAPADEVMLHLKRKQRAPAEPHQPAVGRRAERWIHYWEFMHATTNKLGGAYPNCSVRASEVLGYPPGVERRIESPGANFLTGVYGPFFAGRGFIQSVELKDYPHPVPPGYAPELTAEEDPFPGYFMAAGITIVGAPRGFDPSDDHPYFEVSDWLPGGRLGDGRGKTPWNALYKRMVTSLPQVVRPGDGRRWSLAHDQAAIKWPKGDENTAPVTEQFRDETCIPLHTTFCVEERNAWIMTFPIFHVLGELATAEDETFCLYYTNLGEQEIEVSTVLRAQPTSVTANLREDESAHWAPVVRPGQVAMLHGIVRGGQTIVRNEKWFQETVLDDLEYFYTRILADVVGFSPSLTRWLANNVPLMGFLRWPQRVPPNKLRDEKWGYAGVIATAAGPRGSKTSAGTSIFREDLPLQWSKWLRRLAVAWPRLPVFRP